MSAKKVKNLKSRAKLSTTRVAQKVKASAANAKTAAKAVATEAAQKVVTTATQIQETAQTLQTQITKNPTAAEHLESLRTRFDQMKKSDISERVSVRILSFRDRAEAVRERAFSFAKEIWQKGFQKDGVQKLVITTGLGIATLIAAGIAEDRGRQVQSLKAAVTAQRTANQQLAQQVSQTQADIDEKNLRLMVAEQNQRDEQFKLEQELERAKQENLKALRAAKTSKKMSKKNLAKASDVSRKKRSKKTMIAKSKPTKSIKNKVAKRSDIKVSKISKAE